MGFADECRNSYGRENNSSGRDKQRHQRSLRIGRNDGDQKSYRPAPATSDSALAAALRRSAAFSPMTIDTAWV